MKPGGVGYKSDIDPINDLTNSTIDNAVIMHAVKVIYTFKLKVSMIIYMDKRKRRSVLKIVRDWTASDEP